MPTTTLTIRIPSDVKKAAMRAARLADQSLTGFVICALKQRIVRQCPKCGRAGVFVPASEEGFQ